MKNQGIALPRMHTAAPPRARRPLGALPAALMLVLISAAWIAFGPMQFGGQAAYVIVNGISMEPGFHRGDLVILRQATDYQVGDVVTYRHPKIGPVIHRIISLDGDRYIFKGDNNSWIDAYRPTKAECIGKLWLYIPSAGGVIEQARAPRNMAILTAALGWMVMATITSGADRRQLRTARPKSFFTIRFVVGGQATRRAPNERGPQSPAVAPRAIGLAGASAEILCFALAALAFASLLLAIFAFSRPVTRSTPADITYEQTGAFSYSADASPGVYDSGGAQTGEPVFRRLTDRVAVQLAYRLTADQPADVRGSTRLVAEVGDASGWKRAIEIQPDTAFSGSAVSAAGTVDLARIQALIDRFEQQTGLQRQQYTLAIVAQVSIDGSLSGQELRDSFAPRLEFQLDRQQLQAVKASGSSDPFTQSQKGMLARSREQPNSIALLGFALDVGAARRIALAGVSLAISGSLLLGLFLRRAAGADEPARIQHTYGPLLIAMRDGELDTGMGIVDVATIADLARLAEQHGAMILHAQHGAEHRYFVHDGRLTYRYWTTALGGVVAADMEQGGR